MLRNFRSFAPVWILAAMIAAGVVAPVNAQSGANEQSLKTAHETMINSVKTANLTILQAMIHPRALGFFYGSQFPVQLRGDYSAADALPAVVDDLGRFVAVPTDTVYRVVGQVGVVCMTSAMQPKKGQDQQPRYLRGTYIYIWEGGNWKLVSWHGSDTPLVKK